jgi:hypothetical protein
VVVVVSFVWWPPHPIRKRADSPTVAIVNEIFSRFNRSTPPNNPWRTPAQQRKRAMENNRLGSSQCQKRKADEPSIIVMFSDFVACNGTSSTANRRSDEGMSHSRTHECTAARAEPRTDAGIGTAG